MTAAPVLYAVTANRLRDGVPIYFAGNANWSTSVADAVTDYDGDALLAKSAAGTAPIDAIGRVAIEVTLVDGKASPISLKERIRATGPTA